MKLMHLFTLLGISLAAAGIQAIEVDQSTPKAAATSFAQALEAGDAAAARQLVVGTEPEKRVIDETVQFTSAIKKLREAAISKFGDKGQEAIDPAMNIDTSKALQDSEVKESGDIATVTNKASGKTHLKRVEGKWMVDLTETLKGPGAAAQNPDQLQAMLKAWTAAVTETAAEVEKGQYATPADAHQATNMKMMMWLKSSPTSGPASNPAQPATKPGM